MGLALGPSAGCSPLEPPLSYLGAVTQGYRDMLGAQLGAFHPPHRLGAPGTYVSPAWAWLLRLEGSNLSSCCCGTDPSNKKRFGSEELSTYSWATSSLAFWHQHLDPSVLSSALCLADFLQGPSGYLYHPHVLQQTPFQLGQKLPNTKQRDHGSILISAPAQIHTLAGSSLFCREGCEF